MNNLQEILERVIKKDRAAFDKLHSLYYRRLFYHILRYIKDEDNAEDVLQEVFIKVWNSLNTCKKLTSFNSWIYKIATNYSLNFLRNCKKEIIQRFENKFSDNEVYNMLDENSHPADTILQNIEEKKKLNNILNKLSIEKKEVINLIFHEEMSIKETSRALDIPKGTVKSRLFYSIKELNREFNKGENDE